MKISFELRGIMPLLMHWDNIEGCDDVKEWIGNPDNKNISIAGDDRTPAWTWQTYVYTDNEFVVIPSENLMACLRSAGTRKIMKRQKTYKEATQEGIRIQDEFLDFRGPDGNKIEISRITSIRGLPFKEQADVVKKMGFRLFMKRARVGTSKHVRVRPRFEEWSVAGEAEIMAPELTLEILKEIFTLAGRVGLGDWRPGCRTPGPYGQFEAKVKKAA